MSQSQQYTKVQYGGETTYGTETSSYNELFLVQSCNLQSNNSLIQSRGMGEGLNVKKALYGPFSANGNIVQNLYDFTLLRHWIGALSGAGSSGDKYTLTEATKVNVSSSATYLQPFSIEKVNDTEVGANSVEVGLGCLGTDFTLTTSIGQPLNFNGNFIVRETKYRATGETYTDAQQTAYVMQGGTWKYGATPSALAGVQSVDINYQNGLIVNRRSIETRLIKMPLFGERVYGISIAIEMATSLATTIINDFYGSSSGGTYSPVNDGTPGPTESLEFEISLVNGSKYATIGFDDFVIENISIADSQNGGLRVLTFSGFAYEGKSNTPFLWWTA